MKFKAFLLSLLLIVFLLLCNSIILVIFLKITPALLINNHSYQPQHQEIINYLLSGNDKELKQILPHDEFNHIQDVRRIIAKIPLTLFFLVVLSGFLIKKYQNISINAVIKYSIFLLLAIILAGGLFFMPAFIFFHQIFFPQGNWAFPESSILIQLYPEQFWTISAGIIVILASFELIIIKMSVKKLQLRT